MATDGTATDGTARRTDSAVDPTLEDRVATLEVWVDQIQEQQQRILAVLQGAAAALSMARESTNHDRPT